MSDAVDLRLMAGLQYAPDFVELTPAVAMELAAASESRDFDAGTQILRDDERSDALYMLVEGFAEVTWRGDNRRAPLHVQLGPGDLFGEDALGGSGTTGATAVGITKALRLPADAALGIASRHPEFDRLIRRMSLVQGRRSWIVAALRRSPLFSHCAPADLTRLLPGSELVEGAPSAVVYDGREELDGILLVMEGDSIVRPTGKLRIGRRTHVPRSVALGEGAVIGDTALVDDRPLLQDLIAGSEGCTLLRLTRKAFNHTFNASSSFRRAVLSSPALLPEHRAGLVVSHIRQAEEEDQRVFLTLISDTRDCGEATLLRWLACAAAEEWGDRVAVVTPDPTHEGPPEAEAFRALGEGWVAEVTCPASMPDVTTEGAAQLLAADVILLDLSKVPPPQAEAWFPRVQRVIGLNTDPYRSIQRSLPAALGNRLPLFTAVVPAPPPEPGDVRVIPYGGLRLHRDVVDAARRGRAFGDLDSALKARVHRWMRGVTGRRFAVALGGGGALSWAEAAVLQRLHEAGIPIDMVAGVSGGALVGSFYTGGMDLDLPSDLACADELRCMPGLALLSTLGEEVERATNLSIVSGWAFARFLEQHLPHVRLEDMDLPFFPVAVDADHAVQTTVRAGPLAFGTRASASFPGTFTPTTLDTRELETRRRWAWRKRSDVPNALPSSRSFTRLVDGGLLNNIPDDTLFLEGAQIVLACNVVPGPADRVHTSSTAVLDIQERLRQRSGPLARFVRELDPFVRLDDVIRAIYMLLFQPADWEARTADVKYQGETSGYAFTAWGSADGIRTQALEGERGEAVDAAVEQVKRARESLSWTRVEEDASAAISDALMERIGDAPA